VIASHFRLLVGDFEQTFRFYRDVVGLPTAYPPDAAGPYAEFELGGDKYLGLFDRALMLEALGHPADSERTADDHALLCISVDDVDGEAQRLRALGVEPEMQPADHEPWGMRTTYVRDPEGNLVEFYGPLSTAAAPETTG
jgi:catechol 2,3-dioxygenase-like lactoylglutathione lyase family enzyme